MSGHPFDRIHMQHMICSISYAACDIKRRGVGVLEMMICWRCNHYTYNTWRIGVRQRHCFPDRPDDALLGLDMTSAETDYLRSVLFKRVISATGFSGLGPGIAKRFFASYIGKLENRFRKLNTFLIFITWCNVGHFY